MNETIEYLAEIQGTDIESVRDSLTEKEPNELKDESRDYLNGFLALSDPWDQTLTDRAAAASQPSYQSTEIAIQQFVEWYESTNQTHIKKDTIENYMLYLRTEGYASSTIEQRYWKIVSFARDKLSETVESEIREVNAPQLVPSEDNESRKGDGARPLLEEEYEAMLKATESPREEIILRILWNTGLRATELSRLRIDDILADKQRIRTETAKRDNHIRQIPVPVRFLIRLKKWIHGPRARHARADESPYLIPGDRKKRLRNVKLINIVTDIATRAEVQAIAFQTQDGKYRNEITIHSFRKGYAMQLEEDGVSVRRIQKYLGHSDLSMTQEYLEVEIRPYI